jgi:glycine/serine hydroxymethyltransferase
MGEAEMPLIADLIDRVLSAKGEGSQCQKVRAEVRDLCARFAMPGVSGPGLTAVPV